MVVEAECPANCPTLKGLIQEDVNLLTDDLKRPIQSLEAKLAKAKKRAGQWQEIKGQCHRPEKHKARQSDPQVKSTVQKEEIHTEVCEETSHQIVGKGKGRAPLLTNNESNQVESEEPVRFSPCPQPLHSYENAADPGRYVAGLLLPKNQQQHLPRPHPG